MPRKGKTGGLKAEDLTAIPGVGSVIAGYLFELGVFTVKGLAGKDPERLFKRFCRSRPAKADRCLLYVFRSAVYYAENETHDPELLKWWNWKDR